MPENLLAGFERLGLDAYVPGCNDAGFRDWDSLISITEDDLASINMRLGDRRKLQREIARRHQWPDHEALPSADQLRKHLSASTPKPPRPRRRKTRLEFDEHSSQSSLTGSSKSSSVREPAELATVTPNAEDSPQPSHTWTLSLQELEKEKGSPASGGEALQTVSTKPGAEGLGHFGD